MTRNGTSTDSDAVHAAITDIVRAHTLYSQEQLDLEAHLEGELGIDSVLLQSILGDVSATFKLGSGSLRAHAFRTLGDVIAEVAGRLASDAAATRPVAERDPAPASRATAQAEAHPTGVRQAVITALEERTGVTRSGIELDSHLDADLGLGRIELRAIGGGVEAALGLRPGAIDVERAITVRDLIEAALHGPPERPGPTPEPARIARAARSPSPRPSPRSSDPATGTPVAAIAHRVAGAALAEARSAETFATAGLSRVDQSRVRAAVARELRLPDVVRLDQCDSVQKLERYVAAAADLAVESVGAAGPAPLGRDDAWDGRTMKDFVEEKGPDLFGKVRSFRGFYREKQGQNLYWYGMPLEGPCTNRVVLYDEIAGRRRELLMFASNNYLGLANHPNVIAAIADATRRYGATNTGCRLIGGTNVLHMELERRLARFKGTEACIVFPSGYSANLGTISALAKHHDTVVVDKYNHMSIVDGCRLSGAQRRIFAHNDMADLARVLETSRDRGGGALIAVDGVFSMHGDICDLPAIVRLARAHGARVLVDDAHATGVLGRRGSGTAEHFGLRGGVDVDLELGTMSKTLGGVGGFVCGDEDVIEYLRFYANSYVFAATIPAGVAAGLIASLDVLESEPQRLTTLWNNIRRLKSRLEEAGFDTGGADSAIIPVVVGDDRVALELGRAVRARGLFCQTVVFPGVAVGDARLRISVTSEHTDEDLDLAADILIEAGLEAGILSGRGSP